MILAIGSVGLRDGASAGDLVVVGLLVYVGYRIRRWHFARREQATLEYDVPGELMPTRLEDR